jgi:aromatic ring hydroxylase
MGGQTGAPDEVYNLVSIAYHALKGGELYAQFKTDAEQAGKTELVQFIERCQHEDTKRGMEALQLLSKAARESFGGQQGGGDAYPSGSQTTGQTQTAGTTTG